MLTQSRWYHHTNGWGETEVKFGLRPDCCGFEAYVKGCVNQSKHQLCREQPGGDVKGDMHFYLSADKQRQLTKQGAID